MNKLNLSKSKYCRIAQCQKMFWMDTYKPEEKVDANKEKIFATGTKVGELAKGIFGKYVDIEYSANKTKMIEETIKAMESGAKVITEASFAYNNNFCSVDVLKVLDDGVEIYEVKSSTQSRKIYEIDVSYQYYVLKNLGYNVKKACLVHINNEYIFHKKLELKKFFKIEDVTEIAISSEQDVEDNIKNINEFMEKWTAKKEPNTDIGEHCSNPYDCEYWEYCTRKLPKPNVFDLRDGIQKSTKFKYYYDGIISFEDLLPVIKNEKNIEQINFELNNLEPKIDKQAIKELLNSLKYPLYFIDYETCQMAIPEIEGTNPYQQLPFQYSLHIIKEKGAKIEHKEFLADINDKDFIRHFAESMIKDMPENGSVIIYNKSFEPARNNEIARMYPDLKDELDRINSNIVDFMVPFKQRKFYMTEMHGSASIKQVLPALYPNDPELDYHNLPVVHNGAEAADTFLSLRDKSKEEQEEIRHGLLVYCELDTLAMVKIWEKFNEVIKSK